MTTADDLLLTRDNNGCCKNLNVDLANYEYNPWRDVNVKHAAASTIPGVFIRSEVVGTEGLKMKLEFSGFVWNNWRMFEL